MVKIFTFRVSALGKNYMINVSANRESLCFLNATNDDSMASRDAGVEFKNHTTHVLICIFDIYDRMINYRLHYDCEIYLP